MPNNVRDERAGHEPASDLGAERALTLLHELIEALSAAGNFLAAANHVVSAVPGDARGTLAEALEKSTIQFQRANEAVRKLRDLIRADTSNNESRT